MRMIRICAAPAMLGAFRELHGLDGKTFDEQIGVLRAENMVLPGGWAKSMADHGVQVFDVLYDDLRLQRQWAEENGFSKLVKQPNFAFKILVEQAKAFRPDVVFLYAGGFFLVQREARQRLRDALSRAALVTGFWGDELPPRHTYQSYFGDLHFVFCSSSAYQAHFDDIGIPAFSIGNCFDPTISYDRRAPKIYDLTFSGTTGYGFPDHVKRYNALAQLLAATPLQIWARERSARFRPVTDPAKIALLKLLSKFSGSALHAAFAPLGGKFKRLAELATSIRETGIDPEHLFVRIAHPNGRYFDDLEPLTLRFPGRVSGPLVNSSDYCRLVAQSRLVLNFHRDEEADVGNVRCFEVTGLGSCLITDRGRQLREFFDPDCDIVTFESIGECVDKVSYLLNHQNEIEKIASSGQKVTIARHTVANRCQVVASVLRIRLSSGRHC